MQKKVGENRVAFVEVSNEYDDAYCIETYEFYACVNIESWRWSPAQRMLSGIWQFEI